MAYNNEFTNTIPDAYLKRPEVDLEAAIALSDVSPLGALTEVAASAVEYEKSAGRLIYDKLQAKGYTSEEIEGMLSSGTLTSDQLRELVPEEVDAIHERVQGMSVRAKSALFWQIVATEVELGPRDE